MVLLPIHVTIVFRWSKCPHQSEEKRGMMVTDSFPAFLTLCQYYEWMSVPLRGSCSSLFRIVRPTDARVEKPTSSYSLSWRPEPTLECSLGEQGTCRSSTKFHYPLVRHCELWYWPQNIRDGIVTSFSEFYSGRVFAYWSRCHAKTALPNPISQMTTLAQRNTKFWSVISMALILRKSLQKPKTQFCLLLLGSLADRTYSLSLL